MSTATAAKKAAKAKTDPATLSWEEKQERLRARKFIERPVRLHNEEASDALEEAEVELGKATALARKEANAQYADLPDDHDKMVKVDAFIAGHEAVKAEKKKVDRAKKRVDDTDVVYVFRALESDVWEELVDKHPARPVDEKKDLEYNGETFPPAVIAACLTDNITVEQAAQLLHDLNQGEASILFTTAVAVNQGARASLGKG